MKWIRASRCLIVCHLILCLLLLSSQTGFTSDLTTARGTVAVDAYNGIAATVDRSGVVRLLNVAAPDRPVLLSTYTFPVNLDSVALAGNFLLVAGQGGVQILDISDPSSPRLRTNVSLNAEVTVVRAAGNLCYAAYENNVVLFEIATGKILDQHSYSKFAVNDIALSADSIYVLSADPGSASGIELTKLAVQPSLGPPLASLAPTASTTTGRLSLYAADNLLYLGSVFGATRQTPGLEIIQDRGTSLRVVGSPSPIGAGIARPTGTNLVAFTVASGDGDRGGVGLLNISDPSKTNQLVRTFAASGTAYDMTLYGEFAYVAAGESGLQVVQFATPNDTRNLPAIALNSDSISETAEPGTLLRLTAEVAAADQIRQVDFYLNGQKVATDGNYPFEYRFFQPAADSTSPLMFAACATDIDGNSSCTTPQDLNAKNANTLAVVSVTPTAGAQVKHATRMSLAAKFSQTLDATTVALKNVSVVQLSSKSSGTTPVTVAAVSYQSGSKSIAIQPKSPLSSGNYRVTLSSAIRSSAGKTLTTDYSWTFSVGAATVTWVSPISGNWNTGANWSGGAVPANGDNVVISNTPGITVTLNSGSPEIENLTVGTGNRLEISGGALSVVGTASIDMLDLYSGSIDGPGTVTIATTMDWTNGGVSTTLIIPAKSTLQVSTPFDGNFYLSAGTINNSGTVTQTFAGTPGAYTGFQLAQGGVINNLVGGVWNVNGDVWTYPTDGSAVAFNNAGTFNKIGGTNTSLWSVPFGGAGAVNIQAGTLTFNGQFTGMLAAPIAISANCVLNYGQGGTLDGSKVTGTGTINFTASTQISTAYSFAGTTQILSGTIAFQKASTIATLNLSNGALAGPGPVTIRGTMDWTNGGISTTLVIPAKSALQVNTPFDGNFYLSGGTINNSGTVTQSFAGTPGAYTGFQFSQGGVINNLAGGVWNVNGDVWVYPTDSSAVSFNNAGTFNKVGGTNTTTWSVPYNGAGAFNLQSGTFTLNGQFTGMLAAPIAISANCVLNYGQGGTLDGSKVTGSGTFNFTASAALSTNYTFAGTTQILSGTIAFQKASTIATLNLINGALAGPGPVTISGTMDWTNGGISTTLVIPAKSTLQVNTPFDGNFYLSGGTINNSGTVTQSFAGTPGAYTGFQFALSGTVNNLKGGLWDIVSDVWVYPTDSSNTVFNNAGTLNKTGGTAVSDWSVCFQGSGTVNISSGTLDFNGFCPASKLGGTITVASSSVLTYAQEGTLTSGKITGNGTLNLNTSGSSGGTGTNAISGKLNITTPANVLAGTLSINPGATLDASNVTINNNGSLQVAGTTSLGKLTVDVTASNPSGSTVGGAGSITVSGTLTWTSGSVNVTGVFDVSDMSLSADSSLSITLGSTAISVNAELTLNGDLTLNLTSPNPPVGTVFQVLNFANNYLGNFTDVSIPVLGNNEVLQESLTASGLSFTVAQQQN
jgi:hypothetical protein